MTLTRRSLIATTAAAGAVAATARFATPPAFGASPAILKPTPADQFDDYGTNAEMRWDSVDPRKYLTDQSRLFVRNHTVTPTIDRTTWRLRVFGDGLATPRTRGDALSLSWDDLRGAPATTHESVHECTGNGRSFFATQQGQTVSGTVLEARRGRHGRLGGRPAARRAQARRHLARTRSRSRRRASTRATVTGGVDYGPVRRPFPVSKALDDAVLAWGANGKPLLPDHGYPLRLVLPGWVGIASIKWLGSLEVSETELTSPWNTKWYRLTGGSYPADSPPLTVNPVRSAWELPVGATVPRGGRRSPGARGAAPPGSGTSTSASTAVPPGSGPSSRTAGPATTRRPSAASAGRSGRSRPPSAGRSTQLLARATDRAGRTQPLTTPLNDNGYFFDAVVKHPVTVA